jgi:hypothetical protein
LATSVRDIHEPVAFCDLAAEHGVFFYYCGYFSQKIVEASADAIGQRMDAIGVAEKVKRRVIGAFIEMAQNIVHYSADRVTPADAAVDEVRFGTILIARTDAGVRLSCSNPVDRETYNRLGSKLATISQMNLEAIRSAYREALRAAGDAESKGAGLGLLTLARGAVQPLEFSFTPSTKAPELMIFELRITV